MSQLRSPDGNIDRFELNRLLDRVSWIGHLLETICFIPFLVLCCLASAPLIFLLKSLETMLPKQASDGLLLLIFFGALIGLPLLFRKLMARWYCEPAVRCPGCDASLWGCGKFSVKAFQVQVRPEITACPNCSLPIE